MSNHTALPGLASNSAPALENFVVKSLAIVTLFPTLDEYGEPTTNMDGDYYAVDVELNGQQIIRFGDAYHDKGRDKAEGFVSGFLKAIELATGQAPAVAIQCVCRLDESVNV